MDIFEKHAQTNGESLVAIMASGILSEQLNIEN